MPSIEYYECSYCGIITRNVCVYKKHIETKKHMKMVSSEEKEKKYGCDCGKQFSHCSSYYRHKKQCANKTEPVINKNSYKEDSNKSLVKSEDFAEKSEVLIQKTDNDLAKEWIVQLVKENAELRKMLMDDRKYMENQYRNIMDTQSKLIELCNQPRTINNTTTTTTHNHFNLQFFLNVKCKDAINFSDFIRNLQIDYSDIERFGKLGYTENMSRIFLEGLKELETHRRPIHCTDIKRDIMYVKDDNQWNRDINNEKVRRAIENINLKNSRILCKYITSDMITGDDEASSRNFRIMVETNGGTSCEEREKSKTRIVRNISKEVYLDKMQVLNEEEIMVEKSIND